MPKASIRISDFDYPLPKELIAQYPAAQRDDSRLLVLDRRKGVICHQGFKDIVDYFSCQDVLVLNNTKVIPARILGQRQRLPGNRGGGRQEIFLLENLSPDCFRVLAKPNKKLTKGAQIFFHDGRFSAQVSEDEGSTKIIKFNHNGKIANFWQLLGQLPLPPYIRRPPEDLDQQRYQTVYAQEEGAKAAPTAGLHFTKEILAKLGAKGVKIVYLTLHVSYGTFAPVKCADIRRHKMHKEYFVLPETTARTINQARKNNRGVFVAGTTSARVLEHCAVKDKGGDFSLEAKQGWTDLFIYPPYQFKITDHLLTNFHFPKSTLLMLVSAFAGKDLILKAYQEAIQRRYRFFSYGDAMLIL